jgi:hypothetical protein
MSGGPVMFVSMFAIFVFRAMVMFVVPVSASVPLLRFQFARRELFFEIIETHDLFYFGPLPLENRPCSKREMEFVLAQEKLELQLRCGRSF